MRGIFDVEAMKDPLLLLSRILMMLLFVIFGWQKLTAFDGTTAYFAHLDVPLPAVATCMAIVMELGVGAAIMLGLFTRPLAVVLGLYTIVVALLGHPFWNLSGAVEIDAEIHFFKNISIMAGLLTLFITGAGRYSLDRMFHLDLSRVSSDSRRRAWQ
jgi:putative oxidoreductase